MLSASLNGSFLNVFATGAWIITGGTYAGVMKHVGEAVRDFGLTAKNQGQVIAIGIATWGIIQNRKNLVDEKVNI